MWQGSWGVFSAPIWFPLRAFHLFPSCCLFFPLLFACWKCSGRAREQHGGCGTSWVSHSLVKAQWIAALSHHEPHPQVKTGPGKGSRDGTLLPEIPKRRVLWHRPDQPTEMLLFKTFVSNQELVANELHLFCQALLLKLMSNNLKPLQEPKSERTNSSTCFLWKSPASHLTTPREALLTTQLSPPHPPPSPSPLVWAHPWFISTAYEEISSKTNLIYRRTRHRHKAWELVFDGIAITQHHYDSSLRLPAIIYTDTNQQYWCSKSSMSLLSYKFPFSSPSSAHLQ